MKGAPVLHWPKLFEGQVGLSKTSDGNGYGYYNGGGCGRGYGWGNGDGSGEGWGYYNGGGGGCGRGYGTGYGGNK